MLLGTNLISINGVSMFFSQHLGKGNVGGKYDDGDDERIWHDTEEYAGLRNAERW